MRGPSIRDTVAALAAGRTSCEQLLEAAQLAAQANASLNALAWVDWDGATQAAHQLDREARAGRLRGALHGITVSVKDLFEVRGMPMRAGTRAALPDPGCAEAELVARLRAAGALVFAKTNMHEIALGATGENPWTGDVHNPHDPARQAGGSSSGAAVAVATGIGLAAVGSDTGGSVRIPAAFCGVTGFKPSFGAIPLAGGLHLSWTCDHAGPLARSVDDCALLFEAMAARRTGHATVSRAPRLAVPSDWLGPRLAPSVAARFEETLGRLRARGALVELRVIPALPLAWSCYTPIVRAEAAYVHRAALASGGEGFSDTVLAPLQAGARIGAGEYFEAMRVREQVRAGLERALAGVDALVLPTSPVPPPLRGQVDVEVAGGLRMSTREAVLGQTLPFSLTGLPALSLPMGRAEGLPAALQLVAARDADAGLLALGRWVETALG